ncbi:MAG: D-alanyl-D-alanine carboxypeptidase/D-alanyl-D-alanine-endopeptidase [Actinomycetota bacterium]|nr:D-alanyl-D-alanine carboxypeptidase/D-alanyl-D-alanine-endopeptidase [Actinomycetota bacterium]
MAGRRPNPYPGLLAIALVPALALGGCWRFAEGRRPAAIVTTIVTTNGTTNATTNGTTNGTGGTASTGDTTASTVPADLAAPLLSVRRSPGVLARDVNAAAFVDALQPFLATLDESMCFALSIDGEPVAAVHETTALRPASNVKLLTASVALEVLGAEFVYTTTVTGRMGDGGVVAGNLALVGGGDPLLSNSWWNGPNAKYPPFNVTSIEALADQVKAAGVTAVTGSVVGDPSRYDDEWYAPSWTDDVRFSEGGPVSGLLLNDSREALDRSSNDPAVGAATVFTQLLQERGITVGGAPTKGAAVAGEPTIASIDSQPLPAILQEMLTTSDNNTAEMVVKEMGLVAGGAATREAGLEVVLRTLQSWGIPMDGVALVDGSGLSDDNRLTCNALLAVLQHGAADDPIGNGLPVGGQAGGTLSDAFEQGTPLSGVVRAKTGTLYNYSDGTGGKPGAKALAGYVPLAGGGAIEFAMLLNGPQISEQVVYRPIWEQFAAIVAAYPSGPGADQLGPARSVAASAG